MINEGVACPSINICQLGLHTQWGRWGENTMFIFYKTQQYITKHIIPSSHLITILICIYHRANRAKYTKTMVEMLPDSFGVYF